MTGNEKFDNDAGRGGNRLFQRREAEKIHKFCKDRWIFYEKRDGAYLPSKHDKLIFEDASKEFHMSANDCEYWYNEVDKQLADKMVKDAIVDGKFEELCEEVVAGNGENPWGFSNVLKRFYAIMEEIKTRGIQTVYITVSKPKIYCSSGHYLIGFGFNGNINFLQYENGDIGLVDDGDSDYIFEVDNLKSVMCDISESDNSLVCAKNMFKLLMRNGNIVTVYFNFKDIQK